MQLVQFVIIDRAGQHPIHLMIGFVHVFDVDAAKGDGDTATTATAVVVDVVLFARHVRTFVHLVANDIS